MDIQSLLNHPESPTPTRVTTIDIQSLLNPPEPPVPTRASSEALTLRPPETPTYTQHAPLTTRSDRIRIKTALLFGHKPKEIHVKLRYTLCQIQIAKENRNTPQRYKCRAAHWPKINTPKRQRLEQWLLESPSYRRVAYRHIPTIAPQLGLQGCKEQAMRTAFKLVGYSRRITKRKGFSNDLEVWRERREFAVEAINWPIKRI